MREFAPHLRILLADDAGRIRQFTLDQLCPIPSAGIAGLAS